MNFSTLHKLQQRLFAWGMSKANAADNHAIQLTACSGYSNMADLKRSLLANLQGTVLEIGPGAGANLIYYPADVHWIGVEPNLFIHSYLHQEAQQRGLHHIDLYGGTAESLPVETASVDTVISTHVLCSVDRLEPVLQEVQRVLKSGSHFIFLEHVAAEDGSWTRRIQEKITPVWKTLFDNCHPNRETWKHLAAAGFASVSYERFQLQIPVVSPHIVGIATKSLDTANDMPPATKAAQFVY